MNLLLSNGTAWSFVANLSGSGAGSQTYAAIGSSGASQTLTFAASGDKVYDVTLSANCTFAITTPSTSNTWQRMILIIRPAGHSATLPASSSSIVWASGSVVVPSTSAITVITFGWDGTAPIFGGI